MHFSIVQPGSDNFFLILVINEMFFLFNLLIPKKTFYKNISNINMKGSNKFNNFKII